jgi:hypothetical protein
VHRGEVARHHDHVHVTAPVDQAAGLGQVAVDVAESEQAHRRHAEAQALVAL